MRGAATTASDRERAGTAAAQSSRDDGREERDGDGDGRGRGHEAEAEHRANATDKVSWTSESVLCIMCVRVCALPKQSILGQLPSSSVCTAQIFARDKGGMLHARTHTFGLPVK
jgi:hypothetical protein